MLLFPSCSLLIGSTQTSNLCYTNAQGETERRRGHGRALGTYFSSWPFSFCHTTSHLGRSHVRYPFLQHRISWGDSNVAFHRASWTDENTTYPGSDEQKQTSIIKANAHLVWFSRHFRAMIHRHFLLNEIPIYKQRGWLSGWGTSQHRRWQA